MIVATHIDSILHDILIPGGLVVFVIIVIMATFIELGKKL
jgi:hypothetical protein